jgi:hypothetical protein
VVINVLGILFLKWIAPQTVLFLLIELK